MAKQASLHSKEYSQAMFQELESVDDDRIMALENIKLNKEKVVKSYNKKLKKKQCVEGDVVWKTILPIGTKDCRFGKWSPNWEGPYIFSQVVYREAYRLVDMKGKESPKSINGKFLKRYYSSIWETIIK